jgi:hypothetical protein
MATRGRLQGGICGPWAGRHLRRTDGGRCPAPRPAIQPTSAQCHCKRRPWRGQQQQQLLREKRLGSPGGSQTLGGLAEADVWARCGCSHVRLADMLCHFQPERRRDRGDHRGGHSGAKARGKTGIGMRMRVYNLNLMDMSAINGIVFFNRILQFRYFSSHNGPVIW